jgi:hypothetical protein
MVTGRSDVRIPAGLRHLFLLKTSRSTVWPTQPPIQLYLVFSPGIKRPGRGVHNSPSSKAEVKNRLCYISTPSAHFHGAERENLTYYSIRHLSPSFLLPLYDIMGWRSTTLPVHVRNRGIQSFQHGNVTPKHSFYISICLSSSFPSSNPLPFGPG